MKPFQMNGQHIAIGAQLALMAIISYALVTTTPETNTNSDADLVAELVKDGPVSKEADLPTAVAPIVSSEILPSKLDQAMKVLTPADAVLYRRLLEAHARGEWENAELIIRQIKDYRLMGVVLADRFEKLGATLEEKKIWLERFSDLPEAEDIHAAVKKMGGTDIPELQIRKAWSGGHVIESATTFNEEQDLKQTADSSNNRQLALDIKTRISRGQPSSALTLLKKAQQKGTISEPFVAEAEALISASFFRSGQMNEAIHYSEESARMGQPLGMWIRGLTAWQNKDYEAAYTSFARLAACQYLNDSNEAAAHFWAYRAADKLGHDREDDHLKQASLHPKTFYGVLANNVLKQNPFTTTDKVSLKWNDKYRSVLAKQDSGWRALALIQIGQNDRAEEELRHMNPQRDSQLLHAMLALTSEAPMPALALKLASLKKKKDYHDAFYPILPWTPKEGFEVDRSLLYALARHESRFDPLAVSYRGARGLMQIMPETALHVAKINNLKSSDYNVDALFDPSVNMTVGQKYVQQLSKMPHIGNNLLLILAAYNAGPGNALNWVQRIDTQDPLLFMERIPTRETRQYVARILPHYWAYRTRFNKPLDTLHQLATGQWPTVELGDADAEVRVASK